MARRRKSRNRPRREDPAAEIDARRSTTGREQEPSGDSGGEDLSAGSADDGEEALEPDEVLFVEAAGEDGQEDDDGEGAEALPQTDALDGDVEADENSTALTVSRERLPARVDALTAYIRDVRRFPELEPERERELARRYRETGDTDAARLLVTANLRLVVKLALMYRRALRNVMDLIQEGNIGLLEALKRYDPEQGVRFSTYAAWWIKAYILKFLMDNARLVRVGTTNARRKLLYNLRKEQRKLQSQGIDPTPKLLAERFGVSRDDVIEVDQALGSRDVSVDAPLGEDSRATLADVMAAPQRPVDEEVATAEIRGKVDAAIAEFRETLEERDRAILDQRLVSETPSTLQELGERYGVTREAMRQAEVKLKKRLAVFLRESLGDEIVLMFGGDG